MSSYQFNSSLRINNIDGSDYGDYYCVGKNILGIEKIRFSLTPTHVRTDGETRLVSGETPPVEGYGKITEIHFCDIDCEK